MGIKIPKITVSAEYGEQSSAGDLSLISVGYGCHQAWIYACMFGVSLFPNAGIRFSVPGSQGSFSLMFVISIVVFAVCMLAMGALDRKFIDIIVKKRFVCVGSAVCAAGTLLWSLLGFLGIASLGIDIVAGVLTGIGSGMLTIAWGVCYARRSRISVLLNTAIAIVVAMFIYAFVLHHIPEALAVVLVSGIPIIEMLILCKEYPRPYYQRGELPVFNTLPLQRGRFCLMFGIPVVMFGFSVGTLRQTSMQFIVPSVTLDMQFATLLAAGVAAVLIALVALALDDDEGSWNNQFRIGIPVIVVGILFLPSAITGMDYFGSFMLLIGYMMFEMLLWAYFGDMSQRFNMSPVFVFGIGRGLAAAASLAGSMVPLFATFLTEAYGLDSNILIMVVLIVVVIAYCAMPSERDIAKMVLKCPLITATHAGRFADDSTFVSVNAPTAGQASSAARSTGVQANAQTEGAPKQWFKQNCETVSNRYLLSRREGEVLFLLAKGHNAAYIQEKLFISEGTAKTHIRHIYRKLDVHNQQELMRMVENVDQE